jgi:hypothetical protein
MGLLLLGWAHLARDRTPKSLPFHALLRRCIGLSVELDRPGPVRVLVLVVGKLKPKQTFFGCCRASSSLPRAGSPHPILWQRRKRSAQTIGAVAYTLSVAGFFLPVEFFFSFAFHAVLDRWYGVEGVVGLRLFRLAGPELSESMKLKLWELLVCLERLHPPPCSSAGR